MKTKTSEANHRPKRQSLVFANGSCPFFPNFDVSQDILIQLQQTLCQYINIYLNLIALNFEECCSSCFSYQSQSQQYLSCIFPDISTSQSCAYDLVCIFQQPKLTLSSQGGCSGYSTLLQQELVAYNNQFCSNTTTSTTVQPASTTESILDIIQRNAPAIAGTVGGIGAITVLIQPPTPLITPQGIPPGNPLPGTPGILVL